MFIKINIIFLYNFFPFLLKFNSLILIKTLHPQSLFFVLYFRKFQYYFCSKLIYPKKLFTMAIITFQKMENGNVIVNINNTPQQVPSTATCKVISDDILVIQWDYGKLSIPWEEVDTPESENCEDLFNRLVGSFFFNEAGEVTDVSLIKVQTDKIPAIKTETDKISAEVVKTAAIKVETDKIPAEIIKTAAIKVETDKIPAEIIKTAAIKVETDKIPAEIIKTAAIKLETDKIASIKLETDKIAAIKLETDKIASMIVTLNNTYAEAYETEHHLHAWERWFGQAVSANGEIHVADTLVNGAVTPFRIDAGNSDWGAWVQILGSSDTPTNVGGTYVKYDIHSIQITGNERNAPYFFQIGFGATAAAAVSAGTYTAKVLDFDGADVETAFYIQSKRVDSGTKAWARCKCPGQNTATLDFWLGLHEYLQ